jgi:hypothetical protein
MKVQWKKILLTAIFWLATEICFNILGIDDTANYSEFVFNRQIVVLSFRVLPT